MGSAGCAPGRCAPGRSGTVSPAAPGQVARGHHLSRCRAARRKPLAFHSRRSCRTQTFHPRLRSPCRALLTWGVDGSALGHPRLRVRIHGSSRHRHRQSPLRSILLPGPSSWLALTAHPHPAARAQPAVGSARPADWGGDRRVCPRFDFAGCAPRRQAGYFSFEKKKKRNTFFFFLKKEQTSDELLPSLMFLVPGSPHTYPEKETGAGLASCSC